MKINICLNSNYTSAMDFGGSIVVDNNENVFVLGETQGDFKAYRNKGISGVFLSKFDKDSNFLWTKL